MLPSCHCAAGWLLQSLCAARLPTVPAPRLWLDVLLNPALARLAQLAALCHPSCRIGEQPLVRVALHPSLEGSLQPGATLAGTLDFSQPATAAQQAAADGGGGAAPRCMQVQSACPGHSVIRLQ